jgi:CubicO group peptidase (beta-lactamase class C family)
MKTYRGVSCLVATIAAAAAVAAQAPNDRIQRIEAGLLPPVILKGQPLRTTKLEDRIRSSRIPGVSVAVFNDGRIEWARGWGVADASTGQKVESDTRFQAASISKPVAAAAALALVSRGRMSLDADINTYLTSWRLPDNEHTAKQKVTLRQLLSHSGGVTVSGFRGYASSEAVPTLVQLLDGAKPANSAPVRVDIPAGTRYRYAGGGYSIVQLAIENVTKQSFADAARDLVLAPLGMTHSTFVQPLPQDLHAKAATAHRGSGEPIAGRWHTYPEQAAAGLWTTPEDLARFAIAIQQMAAGTARTSIMSRELAAEMMRPVFDDYGLGLGITGTGRELRFGHGGSNVGFRCQLIAFKETASGVVVMTNGDRGAEIMQDIVRAVAREYGWPGFAPLERTPGTSDPSLYKDFAGRYEIPIRSPPVVMLVETDNGKLYRGSGPARVELMPESASTFFAMDSDMRIEFVRDGSGRVTEARVWQGGIERKATRVQ